MTSIYVTSVVVRKNRTLDVDGVCFFERVEKPLQTLHFAFNISN